MAQWSWDGRIRSELHADPRSMDLGDLTRSMYFLLSEQVNSQYGKLLEHVDPPDPCAEMSPEEESAETAAYKAEICKAARLVSNVELNQWLVGLFDGRFWKEGWAPE